MIGSKGSILAAYGLMAALSSQEQKEIFEITNPYSGLPTLKYDVGGISSYKKRPLTNKQKRQGQNLKDQNNLVN